MKTSHVLIKLCILILVVTSFLYSNHTSAQVPCPPGTPCGTPPNCYSPPLVSGTSQLSHLITNYCPPATTPPCMCDPGLFICISSDIPEAWSCSCSGANACKYIHIRNLVDGDDGCMDDGYPYIAEVELKLIKDANSTKFVICGPLTQWGLGPNWDDSTWVLNNGAITEGTCYTWGDSTQITVTARMPLGSIYRITQLQHWTSVVCGTSDIEIRIRYQVDGVPNYQWSNWFTGLTVNSSPCPEYGNSHGWCQ